MDVLKKEENHTIEDIYALPDGERAELVDGKIILGVTKVYVKCFLRRLRYFWMKIPM